MSVIPFIPARLLLASLAIVTMWACKGSDGSARAVSITCPPGMNPAAKQAICLHGSCGNGFRNEDEACDDGNTIAGDGCSQDCRSTERCGNRIVDHTVGEVCDDGNTAPDEHCCSDCRSCPELAVRPAAEPEVLAAVHVTAKSEPYLPVPPTPGVTQGVAVPEASSPAQASAPRQHAHMSMPATRPAVPSTFAAGRLAEQHDTRMGEELALARSTIAELEQRNTTLQQSLEDALRELTEAQQRLVRGIALR
jgi:cysteine-rich repeat protein